MPTSLQDSPTIAYSGRPRRWAIVQIDPNRFDLAKQHHVVALAFIGVPQQCSVRKNFQKVATELLTASAFVSNS